MFDAVADVISTRFMIPREEIRPESSFDDLDLDSLSQVELATAVKKRLGIDIPDKEMTKISGIAEMVAKLEEKGAGV